MPPITPFPVSPEKLEDKDSRDALLDLNTLMKNTILRAYNRLASLPSPTLDMIPSLSQHIQITCEVTANHLRGDELFFTRPNPYGTSLIDILGVDCNPNSTENQVLMKEFAQHAREWNEEPSKYSQPELQEFLSRFNHFLDTDVRNQLVAINASVIKAHFTEDYFRNMTIENIQWNAANVSMDKLMPFILSHHDTSTNAYWPYIPEDAMQMLPPLVAEYASCWKLAPYDPLTSQPQAVPV